MTSFVSDQNCTAYRKAKKRRIVDLAKGDAALPHAALATLLYPTSETREGKVMPFITTSDGVELRYEVEGEGIPLVFTHGNMGLTAICPPNPDAIQVHSLLENTPVDILRRDIQRRPLRRWQ